MLRKSLVVTAGTLGFAILSACGDDGPGASSSGGSSSSGTASSSSGSTSGDGGSTSSSSGSSSGGNEGGTGNGCASAEVLSGDLDWQIQSNGIERTAKIHLPSSYNATTPTAVVLNFHGYTASATQQASYTSMNDKSNIAGFIAVHPEGTGSSWNAGLCCGSAQSGDVKDVQFVGELLNEIEKRLCVDKKRIFATGLSNGGFLSNRLACEMSDRIAAIAPVAGQLITPADCAPGRPVPVLAFHGTADGVVPYNGGAPAGTPSVADSIAKWASIDKCTDAPHETLKQGDTTCMTQSACDAGSEVTLCTIDAGGHTWPGSTTEIAFLGKTTQAIKATDAAWDFFQKHPLP